MSTGNEGPKDRAAGQRSLCPEPWRFCSSMNLSPNANTVPIPRLEGLVWTLQSSKCQVSPQRAAPETCLGTLFAMDFTTLIFSASIDLLITEVIGYFVTKSRRAKHNGKLLGQVVLQWYPRIERGEMSWVASSIRTHSSCSAATIKFTQQVVTI